MSEATDPDQSVSAGLAEAEQPVTSEDEFQVRSTGPPGDVSVSGPCEGVPPGIVSRRFNVEADETIRETVFVIDEPSMPVQWSVKVVFPKMPPGGVS